MSYVNLLVHAIWSTKDRKPLMNLEQKDTICQHIREKAVEKSIFIHQINGYTEHLHALISMSAEQSLATIMNLIKGESSYWANRNLRFREKFGWQDKYAGFSVGQSEFDRVYNYIKNQEEHHRHKTFEEEYQELMKEYALDEDI